MDHQNDCPDHVLIFKTNVRRKSDIKLISGMLNAHSGIVKWNVDIADIDNVLRVESIHSDCGPVIALLNSAGYTCEELVD